MVRTRFALILYFRMVAHKAAGYQIFVNIQEGSAMIYLFMTFLLKIFCTVLIVLHTTKSFHSFAVIS